MPGVYTVHFDELSSNAELCIQFHTVVTPFAFVFGEFAFLCGTP